MIVRGAASRARAPPRRRRRSARRRPARGIDDLSPQQLERRTHVQPAPARAASRARRGTCAHVADVTSVAERSSSHADLVGLQRRVDAEQQRRRGRDLRRGERRADRVAEVGRAAVGVRLRCSRRACGRSGCAGSSRRRPRPARPGRRTAGRGSRTAGTEPSARSAATPITCGSAAGQSAKLHGVAGDVGPLPTAETTTTPFEYAYATASRSGGENVSTLASCGSRTPPRLRLITRAPRSTAHVIASASASSETPSASTTLPISSCDVEAEPGDADPVERVRPRSARRRTCRGPRCPASTSRRRTTCRRRTRPANSGCPKSMPESITATLTLGQVGLARARSPRRGPARGTTASPRAARCSRRRSCCRGDAPLDPVEPHHVRARREPAAARRVTSSVRPGTSVRAPGSCAATALQLPGRHADGPARRERVGRRARAREHDAGEQRPSHDTASSCETPGTKPPPGAQRTRYEPGASGAPTANEPLRVGRRPWQRSPRPCRAAAAAAPSAPGQRRARPMPLTAPDFTDASTTGCDRDAARAPRATSPAASRYSVVASGGPRP